MTYFTIGIIWKNKFFGYLPIAFTPGEAQAIVNLCNRLGGLTVWKEPI